MQHQWIIDGYKGIAASHLQCDSKLHLAVSVALGNKLFSHVVTSANVATAILKWINRLNLPGNYDFIPIDKLKVQDVQYPKSGNLKPLIQCVTYPLDMEIAFKVSYNTVIGLKNSCEHV